MDAKYSVEFWFYILSLFDIKQFYQFSFHLNKLPLNICDSLASFSNTKYYGFAQWFFENTIHKIGTKY